MFDYGVFRLTGNGTPQSIYTGAGPDDGSTGGFFGIRYELAAAKLKNGKTRLYVHDGRNEVFDDDGNMIDASRVVRTDDARAATPVFQMLSSPTDGTPGFSSFDICAQQCSYDMPIAVSPKNPDVVMIGGQTQYGELPPYAGADRSNGRNIMLSRNAGQSFTDMSGEAKDPFEANHPDVQILAFNTGEPERPVRRQRRRDRPDERPLRQRLVRLRRAGPEPLRRRPDGLPHVPLVHPGQPDHRSTPGSGRCSSRI